jgi:hypothetical protein
MYIYRLGRSSRMNVYMYNYAPPKLLFRFSLTGSEGSFCNRDTVSATLLMSKLTQVHFAEYTVLYICGGYKD